MTKEEILEVIYKHLGDAVDGLDTSSIDPGKSMLDYGASSLDIVSIVSSSMRELKIKVPRTELKGIPNIDGLADLFVQHSS